MSKKKEVRVNKKDFNRVLVTETIPYETPIIVSNDGFYNNVVKYQTANDIAKLLTQRVILGKKRKAGIRFPMSLKLIKMRQSFGD